MKTKTRKLFGILLSLVLVLGLIPGMCFTANAEETQYVSVSTYDELCTAISNGYNVTLANDIVVTETITLNSNKRIIIDGGGYRLTGIGEKRAFIVEMYNVLALKNMTVIGFSDSSAGAIRNLGTLVLDTCTFSGNCSPYNNRGGGAIENQGTLYAVDTVFSGNYSREIGGAINNYRGNLYLLNCTFEGNYTTANDTRYGGAIGINTNDSQNVIRIINCTFTNNYYNSDPSCRSDLGVYRVSSNLENYTIAGCGDMTITGNSNGLTKELTGHAILDYSDLDNIVFIIPAASHTHDDITFTAWTDSTKMPTAAGNYYLDTDVTYSGYWLVPKGETNLCLNGHAITCTSGDSAVMMGNADSTNSSSTLNIYDETGEGKITHSSLGGPDAGGGIFVGTYNTLKLYGGQITCNKASYGGGVYINGSTASVYLYGGSVADNIGGGIDTSASDSLIVSGSPVVKDNKDQNGTDTNNVCLSGTNTTLMVEGELTENADIGINTTSSKPYTFTTGYSAYMGTANPADFFKSDDEQFIVNLDANGEAQLTLPVTNVTGLTLDSTEITLLEGNTESLTAIVTPAEADQTVTWASDNTEVATVDENGQVTAVAKGTATVTATAINGTPEDTSDDMTATCIVTVEHRHRDFSERKWAWTYIDGKCTVTSTYDCSCGLHEVLEGVVDEGVRNEADKTITYTATDDLGNTSTRTYNLEYTVTYSDEPVKRYAYGATCKLTATDRSNWFVKSADSSEEGPGEQRASGTDTFYFPVTEDVVVTATPSDVEEPQALIGVEAASVTKGDGTTLGKLTYVVYWSLPKGATVKSTMIYRCKEGASGEVKSVDQLMAMNNLRSYNMNLKVQNGRFVYNLSKLSANSYQAIIAQVDYTYKGTTYSIQTDLMHCGPF